MQTQRMIGEMEDLRIIIEQVFGVRLLNKKRLLAVVDARMCFSKILRDRGYTFKSIGDYLSKDHTTIMHYIDKCVTLFKQEAVLFENYMICKDRFLKDRELIIDEIKDKDLHMKVARLNMQLDILIKERGSIMEDIKKYKRFKRILNLLNSKIPSGSEYHIEDKIMKMLNG